MKRERPERNTVRPGHQHADKAPQFVVQDLTRPRHARGTNGAGTHQPKLLLTPTHPLRWMIELGNEWYFRYCMGSEDGTLPAFREGFSQNDSFPLT